MNLNERRATPSGAFSASIRRTGAIFSAGCVVTRLSSRTTRRLFRLPSQKMASGSSIQVAFTGPRMKRIFAALLFALACWSGALFADDVSDERHILCSALSSDICLVDEGCATLAPEELNIPQFIRVDARSGKLSTTVASGHNRETVADSVSRAEGQLILQGKSSTRPNYSWDSGARSGHGIRASSGHRPACWMSVPQPWL